MEESPQRRKVTYHDIPGQKKDKWIILKVLKNGTLVTSDLAEIPTDNIYILTGNEINVEYGSTLHVFVKEGSFKFHINIKKEGALETTKNLIGTSELMPEPKQAELVPAAEQTVPEPEQIVPEPEPVPEQTVSEPEPVPEPKQADLPPPPPERVVEAPIIPPPPPADETTISSTETGEDDAFEESKESTEPPASPAPPVLPEVRFAPATQENVDALFKRSLLQGSFEIEKYMQDNLFDSDGVLKPFRKFYDAELSSVHQENGKLQTTDEQERIMRVLNDWLENLTDGTARTKQKFELFGMQAEVETNVDVGQILTELRRVHSRWNDFYQTIRNVNARVLFGTVIVARSHKNNVPVAGMTSILTEEVKIMYESFPRNLAAKITTDEAGRTRLEKIFKTYLKFALLGDVTSERNKNLVRETKFHLKWYDAFASMFNAALRQHAQRISLRSKITTVLGLIIFVIIIVFIAYVNQRDTEYLTKLKLEQTQAAIDFENRSIEQARELIDVSKESLTQTVQEPEEFFATRICPTVSAWAQKVHERYTGTDSEDIAAVAQGFKQICDKLTGPGADVYSRDSQVFVFEQVLETTMKTAVPEKDRGSYRILVDAITAATSENTAEIMQRYDSFIETLYVNKDVEIDPRQITFSTVSDKFRRLAGLEALQKYELAVQIANNFGQITEDNVDTYLHEFNGLGTNAVVVSGVEYDKTIKESNGEMSRIETDMKILRAYKSKQAVQAAADGSVLFQQGVSEGGEFNISPLEEKLKILQEQHLYITILYHRLKLKWCEAKVNKIKQLWILNKEQQAFIQMMESQIAAHTEFLKEAESKTSSSLSSAFGLPTKPFLGVWAAIIASLGGANAAGAVQGTNLANKAAKGIVDQADTTARSFAPAPSSNIDNSLTTDDGLLGAILPPGYGNSNRGIVGGSTMNTERLGVIKQASTVNFAVFQQPQQIYTPIQPQKEEENSLAALKELLKPTIDLRNENVISAITYHTLTVVIIRTLFVMSKTKDKLTIFSFAAYSLLYDLLATIILWKIMSFTVGSTVDIVKDDLFTTIKNTFKNMLTSAVPITAAAFAAPALQGVGQGVGAGVASSIKGKTLLVAAAAFIINMTRELQPFAPFTTIAMQYIAVDETIQSHFPTLNTAGPPSEGPPALTAPVETAQQEYNRLKEKHYGNLEISPPPTLEQLRNMDRGISSRFTEFANMVMGFSPLGVVASRQTNEQAPTGQALPAPAPNAPVPTGQAPPAPAPPAPPAPAPNAPGVQIGQIVLPKYSKDVETLPKETVIAITQHLEKKLWEEKEIKMNPATRRAGMDGSYSKGLRDLHKANPAWFG